jgi:hypothetical protein
MSYKGESHRVLIGSLNLLAPGDKIPDEDALQLTNFRVDQAGALRSRQGMGNDSLDLGGIHQITHLGSPAPVHSIARRGNVYYFGAGGSLYRIGSSTPITALGDGQLFGLAAMNGYMWVMNRGVQGKDDGAVFSKWQVEGPTSPLIPTQGGLLAPNPPTGQDAVPLGDYQYYVTYVDATGVESEPGPASPPYTADGKFSVDLTAIPVASDPSITGRRVYATGGTLGGAYRVADIPDNTTTEWNYTLGDDDITEEGILMQTGKDPAPACAGMSGPYFARLLAFNSTKHPNRLWWTKPTQPFYWYFAANEVEGNWVDIGEDGEAILNTTCHAKVAIIYKERSIWRLTGDPDTGFLELVRPKTIILGPRAMVNAGKVDYFATIDGIFRFDLDKEIKLSQKLDPMFQNKYTELGPTHISPLERSSAQTCAMEMVNGQVLFSYPEAGAPAPTIMLVYHVETERWAQHVYGIDNGGFTALAYPMGGSSLWGGLPDGSVYALQADGARDASGGPINVAYQSRFQDQGAPGSDKVYTSLSIEFEMAGNADALVVSLWYNNGTSSDPIGSLVRNGISGRQTLEWGLGPSQEGKLARNAAVRITGDTLGEVVVHAIYLYYYVEALVTTSVVTIPLDLGSNKVKQFRELQLDIDTSTGAAAADFSTDLPGNSITVRDTRAVATSTGRRNFQLPFAATYEGRLVRLAITGASGFRLYAARVLMRVIGVYIEAYEAAAGFLWDSMEHDFSSHITHVPRGYAISLHADPIKRARQLEIEIDTRGGDVTATLFSDQPGGAMAARAAVVLNTASDGHKILRAWFGQVEGHLFRLKLSGASTYLLFGVRIEILPVGTYFSVAEAVGGAIYDSREIDLGSPKFKECRELELDIDTDDVVTATLYSDAPGGVMAVRITLKTINTTTATNSGRRKVMLPLIPFVEGRLLRLTLASAKAFRLYDARVRMRAIGTFIDKDEATGGALWDSTELDYGSQKPKQFRAIELDLQCFGATTLNFWTDQPGNAMVSRFSMSVDTSGTATRRTLQIPLPQGISPFLVGRLARVTLSGNGAYKLFGARVNYRLIGTYVQAYEAAGGPNGAVWDSTPVDLGQPQDKVFDQLRFELEADGTVVVTLWTDLPGEALTQRFLVNIVASGRRFVTMPLPGDTHGRIVRVIAQSSAAFTLYQVQISRRTVGRYFAVGVADSYRALESDFGTERVKDFKRLEVDIQTDGPLTLTMFTDGPAPLASRYTATINTAGLRGAVRLRLPGNVRGRIARIEIGGAASGRLYALRAWVRTVGESGGWAWQPFPVEESAALPEWTNLPVEPTPPDFQWADLPVEPTAPEWSWAPFTVAETPPAWNWAVFPVEDTSDEWTWADLPMGEAA